MGWRAIAKSVVSFRALMLGLLVMGLTLTLLILNRPFEDTDRSYVYVDQATKAYARSAQIEAQANCRNLAGLDRAYCIDKAYRSARAEQRQEYQLQAERDNAAWTAGATKAAAFGLLLTVATLVALFINYEQQQLQIEESRDRFRKNFAHTQSVSHQELRPYVFVDKITPEQVSERAYRVVIWFRNFGRTPARNLETVVTTYVTRDVSKLRPLKPRADRIELGTAAPDAYRRALVPLIFTKQQWEAPAFDQAHGVVRIKYTYTDDTDTDRFEESIDYLTDPIALTKDEPMFYLLNEQRIRRERRYRAKQGDFIPLMRRIEAKRRRREREEAEKPSAEGEAEH